MGPKKAAPAATPAKEAKEKKPAAAPAHASYKGQSTSHHAIAWSRNPAYRCRVSMLTLQLSYDQGSHPQRKSYLVCDNLDALKRTYTAAQSPA